MIKVILTQEVSSHEDLHRWVVSTEETTTKDKVKHTKYTIIGIFELRYQDDPYSRAFELAARIAKGNKLSLIIKD